MNQNIEETFFLDTEEGSKECKIITSMYSETRKKYYLIYEYVENKEEEIFVSSYEPNEEDGTLNDITDDAYINQLKGYKEYIETISNKPVHTYLFSILEQKIKKID